MSKLSAHERIRQTQDRTYTLRMLQTVLSSDPSNNEWALALDTLRWLEDYRTIEPLRSYLENRGVPEYARCEVARTLASFDLTTTSAERRQWWDSDDVPLREYSLRLMESPEGDIVASVAGQDADPLQAIAVDALGLGFEQPEYQALKVRCLASDRDDVRVAAVSSVIWDEPLSAEPALQDLLGCGNSEVERLAADTLQYYPSLATLSLLRNRIGRISSQSVERQLAASIDFIEATVRAELERCTPAAQQRLAVWAEAIGFVPTTTDGPEPTAGPARHRPLVSLDVLDKALDTTVGSLHEKCATIRSIDWSAVAANSRTEVADRMARHPDPEVRAIATVPLAMWNESSRLMALVEDEHAVVRKSAMYALADVDVDRDIASFARSRLEQQSGTESAETLTTFARHAGPELRRTVLFQLADTDDRFSVRHAAIILLDEASGRTELKRLMTLLDQPPFVNWAVHTALLETNATLGANPQTLERLAGTDNVHIAAAATRVIERQAQSNGNER